MIQYNRKLMALFIRTRRSITSPRFEYTWLKNVSFRPLIPARIPCGNSVTTKNRTTMTSIMVVRLCSEDISSLWRLFDCDRSRLRRTLAWCMVMIMRVLRIVSKMHGAILMITPYIQNVIG